jgi:hypothetical protein
MARRTTAEKDDLQTIPGVGRRTAEDLRKLGVRSVADLRGRDPQAMYDALRAIQGTYLDRCVLYVFRCAVYYAGRTRHDPELLKWWNWTDQRAGAAGRPRRRR